MPVYRTRLRPSLHFQGHGSLGDREGFHRDVTCHTGFPTTRSVLALVRVVLSINPQDQVRDC